LQTVRAGRQFDFARVARGLRDDLRQAIEKTVTRSAAVPAAATFKFSSPRYFLKSHREKYFRFLVVGSCFFGAGLK